MLACHAGARQLGDLLGVGEVGLGAVHAPRLAQAEDGEWVHDRVALAALLEMRGERL